MHRPTRRLLTTLLVTLALAAPTAASAAPSDGSGEGTHTVDEYLATLTPTERADFVETMLPARTIASSTSVPTNMQAVLTLRGAVLPMATTKCWTIRQTVTAYAWAGNALYTAYHVGGWCATGKTVVSAKTSEYGGQPTMAGWRYAGKADGGSRVVLNEGRSFTQFKFILGTGGWDIQTHMPCARVRGTAKGAYTDTVCGVR